jgi:hypothetical protein
LGLLLPSVGRTRYLVKIKKYFFMAEKRGLTICVFPQKKDFLAHSSIERNQCIKENIEATENYC